MNRRSFVYTIFVFLILSAGCIETFPRKGMDVYYSGSFNDTDSGFRMDGQLRTGGGIPAREVYRDVTLCLYAADGDVIHTERIGDWHLDIRKVTIQTSLVPEYIVIDSPDFWDGKNRIEYYDRINDNDVIDRYGSNGTVLYHSLPVTSREELPYAGCAD